jgi:predicted RNase H-like HicB family nuclease
MAIESQSKQQVSFAAYVEEAIRRAVVTCEPDGCTAMVPELLGCISYGDTPEEALANLRDAVEAWVLTAVKFGDPIPVYAGRGALSILPQSALARGRRQQGRLDTRRLRR